MLSVIAVRNRKTEENGSDEDDDEDWDEIDEAIPGKTSVQCLQRYMRHLNKKGGSGKKGNDFQLNSKEKPDSSQINEGSATASYTNNRKLSSDEKASCVVSKIFSIA